MWHFWAQNGQFSLNKFFLVKTINITFIYLLVLFIVQNLKKTLGADPELWGCTIFWPKMIHLLHLPQTRIFLEKIIKIIFIYLLAPFILQNFKKNSYNRSKVMRMHHFWAQNDPIAQTNILLEKNFSTIVLFSSIYWSLSLWKI